MRGLPLVIITNKKLCNSDYRIATRVRKSGHLNLYSIDMLSQSIDRHFDQISLVTSGPCDWVEFEIRLINSPIWLVVGFVQVQIKENIKAPRHWPLRGEFNGDWWIPSQRVNKAANLMTSSWCALCITENAISTMILGPDHCWVSCLNSLTSWAFFGYEGDCSKFSSLMSKWINSKTCAYN